MTSKSRGTARSTANRAAKTVHGRDTKRITQDVATGFDPALYLPGSRMDAPEWARQIAKRYFVDSALALAKDVWLQSVMPTLLSDPLAAFPYGRQLQASSKHIPRPPYVQQTVRPLRLKDLSSLLSQLKDQGVVNEHELVDESTLKIPELAFLSPFGRLMVDLSATDAQLRRDFSAWLHEYRRASGQQPVKFHRTNVREEMDDWHQSKLLQVADLDAWSRWTGTPIKNETMAQLVFSENPSVELLRNRRRKIRSLFTLETIHALLAMDLSPY